MASKSFGAANPVLALDSMSRCSRAIEASHADVSKNYFRGTSTN
jgi:hypothetical protein